MIILLLDKIHQLLSLLLSRKIIPYATNVLLEITEVVTLILSHSIAITALFTHILSMLYNAYIVIQQQWTTVDLILHGMKHKVAI